MNMPGGVKMQVSLKQVPLEEREILANLLEKYEYEFSQYNGNDVNKLGLYGYYDLDSFWREEGKHAYFIDVDGKLAGFVMVYNYPETGDPVSDHVIYEFFVMFKYRGAGVGKQAFFQTLDKHRGQWCVGYHPKNTASAHFWPAVISEYTGGKYKTINDNPEHMYPDGSIPVNLYFDNRLL